MGAIPTFSKMNSMPLPNWKETEKVGTYHVWTYLTNNNNIHAR